jgi:transposase
VDSKLPQGRDDCPRCAALEERVAELEKLVAELKDRLLANSSNSSTAPSSNPLWAPKLKPRKPTGKKPGGQSGHEGHHRTLLPIEQVDEVVEHLPGQCSHCHHPFDQHTPRKLRHRHQVAELPPRAVIVTEHQSYACTCAACGHRTVTLIPASIQQSVTGPRLGAALCYLSACVHGSRRAIEEVATELLGCPLSLGTLSNREREMTQALESGYQQVREQVQAAPAKNVDETGWKRAGRWLWVAATQTAALFRIDRGRNWHGLQNLLGELVQGTVCSDRHGLYERLKIKNRGICWAHLKRDFQRFIDRGGATLWLGEQGLEITSAVCRLWHRWRQGHIGRSTLRRLLTPLRRRMKGLLDRGLGCGETKAKYFCRNLSKVYKAMWTFARIDGIEPTNNHAERMLRPAVIWRKKCFGSHSQDGCHYAERMLTAIQTLRLNHRSVMNFLSDTLDAHRRHLPAPTLV